MEQEYFRFREVGKFDFKEQYRGWRVEGGGAGEASQSVCAVFVVYIRIGLRIFLEFCFIYLYFIEGLEVQRSRTWFFNEGVFLGGRCFWFILQMGKRWSQGRDLLQVSSRFCRQLGFGVRAFCFFGLFCFLDVEIELLGEGFQIFSGFFVGFMSFGVEFYRVRWGFFWVYLLVGGGFWELLIGKVFRVMVDFLLYEVVLGFGSGKCNQGGCFLVRRWKELLQRRE